MPKQKLNMTVGRFMPFTKGHLNMILEGDAPCIIFRINSSDKPIEQTKTGIKIGSKKYTKDTIKNVVSYIDNPVGNLTEQEKELLKRPFTNDLIDKEFEIIGHAYNKNIHSIVVVKNMFDAFDRFNAYVSEHSDEYEPNLWMCGDDRVDDYAEIIDKYDELETYLGSGTNIKNICKGKLKTSIGKGRTEGVSGTDVRKAILTNDKAKFKTLMPNGVDNMFDDFVGAFNEFNTQLQNTIKEHKMMTLKEYIIESIDSKYQKELDDLLKEKDLTGDETIYSLWRNTTKKEIYLYKTDSYSYLLELWKKSKQDPKENGRYLSFQDSEESALHVCDAKPFSKLKVINRIEQQNA